MNEPCISVGVPAYNQSLTIEETVQSLLCQTTPPLEIVVSDNHSTDATAKILEKYRGQLRVISPPSHLPMAAHWNFLANELKADWFTLLSSDDVAFPQFTEVLAREARRHPDAALIRSGFWTIDDLSERIEKRHLLSVSKVTKPPRTFLEQLYGPKTSFAAFAVRRACFDSVGGFPELNLWSDWALWLQLSSEGNFIYAHDTISGYRVGDREQRNRDRLLLGLQDDTRLYTTIIPDVASRFSLSANRRFLRASRSRFRARLGFACEVVADDLIARSEVASELREWAVSVGEIALLDQFVAGKPIRRRRAWPAIRSRLRLAYQSIRR